MSRFIVLWVGALQAVAGAGCANLKVKKVPVEERAEGSDEKHHGFRYYLPRPYIAVQEKVLVCERKTLVIVNLTTNSVCFLDGPRKGENVPIEALKLEDAGGAMRAVTPAEIDRLRAVLGERQAGGEGGVQQVAAKAEPVNTDPLKVPSTEGLANGKDCQTLDGKIQIVFMPDLDEQYVIKSCNVLAKSAFRLNFKHGAELTHVGGHHDSTTVALELLNTVSSAIDAAKTVGEATFLRQGKLLKGGAGAELGFVPNEKRIWVLSESSWIKPGLYRLNKPWEMGEGPEPTGCGLLAKLGLPVVVDFSLVPLPMPAKKGG